MRRKRAGRAHPGILETFVDPLFGAFGAFLFIFLMVMLIIGVVGAPPVINTEHLPAAISGVRYEVWLSGRGGVGQYAWRLAPGSRVPEGLELDVHGHLGGVPRLDGADAEESHTFTVELEALQLKAEDPADTVTRRRFALAVRRDRPIEPAELLPVRIVSEDPLPAATVGRPYRLALAAVGGLAPYTWASATPLPAGLELDARRGLLAGRPRRAAERLELRFSVADARPSGYDGSRDEKPVTLTIAAPPPPPRPEPARPPELRLLSRELPPATAGSPYRVALAVRGGAPPLRFRGQGLPPGLGLTPDGVLEGTPRAAGDASLQVTVEDSQAPARKVAGTLPLAVRPTLPPLRILTSGSLPAAHHGRPYELALAATGGDGSYRWSVAGELPPGLELIDGSIIGRPRAETTADHRFEVRVGSGGIDADKEVGLEVVAKRPIPPLSSKRWLWLGVVFVAHSVAARYWRWYCIVRRVTIRPVPSAGSMS